MRIGVSRERRSDGRLNVPMYSPPIGRLRRAAQRTAGAQLIRRTHTSASLYACAVAVATTRETYARKSLPFAVFSYFRLVVSPGARNAPLATYYRPLRVYLSTRFERANSEEICIFIKASLFLFSYKSCSLY